MRKNQEKLGIKHIALVEKEMRDVKELSETLVPPERGGQLQLALTVLVLLSLGLEPQSI